MSIGDWRAKHPPANLQMMKFLIVFIVVKGKASPSLPADDEAFDNVVPTGAKYIQVTLSYLYLRQDLT